MPLPVGTVPIGGPLIDTTAADLAASAALRDAGAISFRGGELRKVNAAGDNWVGVPGHVVGATEPDQPVRGATLVRHRRRVPEGLRWHGVHWQRRGHSIVL